MSRDVCILIKAQLSRSYLDALRQRYGADISIENFSEVQSSSVMTLWRKLRKIAPKLLLIALATRAQRIAVVGADYAETPLSKFAAVSALGSLTAATLASAFQTLIAGFEITRFLRRQRHAVAAGH